MSRQIYAVDHPDWDTEITVIAENEDEAINLARLYIDHIDAMDSYTATPTEAQGIRWVGFESESDARNQARALEAAGVELCRIWRRVTSFGSGSPVGWEVGARDDLWCRLPSGVLCGGGE